MNASQFILLFASFIILSISILLVNNSAIENRAESNNSKNQIALIFEAKNLFEEIKNKLFDERIVSMISLNRDSLTKAINFGPDNETYPNYDDIDDYHNFVRSVKLDNRNYNLRVSVQYLNESNPNTISSTPTFFKRVQIICLDETQTKIFELSQIFSVW